MVRHRKTGCPSCDLVQVLARFQFPDAGHFDSYLSHRRLLQRSLASFNSLTRDILILTLSGHWLVDFGSWSFNSLTRDILILIGVTYTSLVSYAKSFQFPEAGHFDSYQLRVSNVASTVEFQFPDAGHFDSYKGGVQNVEQQFT